MDLQTRCLEYLKQEGFSPEVSKDDKNRIVFKYQLRTILIYKDDEDDNYLYMLLPAIYAVNPSNRSKCLEVANEVGQRVKTTKIYVYDNVIWVSAESFVGPTPNLADFIPRCLDALVAGRQMFFDLIREPSLENRESTKKATGWRSFFKRTDN